MIPLVVPLSVEAVALVVVGGAIVLVVISMLVSAVRTGSKREGELKSEMAKEALDASSTFHRGMRARSGLSRLERYRRMRMEARLRDSSDPVSDPEREGGNGARGDGGGG